MTSTEYHVQAVASQSRLDTLRGNCMGAAVLLIVQNSLHGHQPVRHPS